MVYDAATGQVVLFGGDGSSGYLNDTWTWNGTTWVQQNPSSSPPGRTSASMAYDAATGQVVLFGGYSNGFINDTWTWNGTTWTQQNPSSSPSARDGASMVYDAATGQVVLFGGLGSNLNLLNDTWTWNGTTWVQQDPSSSPRARNNASMAYDATTGQVVLFGGYGSSNSLLNDTWTWNGTTWTQQNPSSSPPARQCASMAYDAATGQVVLFGGADSSDDNMNDTWTWNGTTWVQQSPSSRPPARQLASMVYDAATGQVLLFGGDSSSSFFDDTWTLQLGAVNMGTANVCSSGSPTPCSTSATLTFTFSGTSGTIEAPVVLTQGATGLDFTDAGTGTCTSQGTSHSYASGSTCTVVVTFAPKIPGVRLGAVELLNSSGTVIATELVSGTGTGPQAVISPGAISTAAGDGTAGDSGNGSTATNAELYDPVGVAVDGAGNLYIADEFDEQIRKVTAATGDISTVAGGGSAPSTCTGSTNSIGDGCAATSAELNEPTGVAVDGAGNLYIADQSNNRIRKVTAATGDISTVAGNGGPGGYMASQDTGTTAATSAELFRPTGVTVDGAGNLYIADYNNDRIREVTAATGFISTVAGDGTRGYSGDGGTATTTELNYPAGVAVDGAGNLYIADVGNNRIRKVTAATGFISTVAGNGTGGYVASQDTGTTAATSAELNGPSSVAVDGAGNLYIAEFANNRIRKVTAATGDISTVAGDGTGGYSGDGAAATSAELNYPTGVTVDGAGNLYIGDEHNHRVRKVTTTAAPLSFATTTTDGTTDTTDGTQTVTVANIGNAALSFAIPVSGVTNPTSPTDFTFASSTSGACPSLTSSATAQGMLASGATCTVPITFMPVLPSSGALSESLTFTDNSLNASAATQSISLTGTAALPAPTLTGISPSSGSTAGGTGVTLTGTGFVAGSTSVTFGGTAIAIASVTVNSATSITVTSPAHAAGSVSVTVTTPGGTSGSESFTYYTPALTSLTVSGFASPAILTEGGTVTVTALDQNGDVDTSFTGTVTLSSSDAKATLPAAYTFTSSDAGAHTFNVTLNTLGSQTITATSGSVSASQTGILVGDAVWVLGSNGNLTKLNSQGAPLVMNTGAMGSSSSYGAVAFDSTGDVWTVSANAAALTFFNALGGSPASYTGGGLNAPSAVAVDGAGYIWVANSGGNTVSEFNNAGAAQSPSGGYGSSYVSGEALSAPSAIAIDNTGGVWVANKTGNSVTHIFGAAAPVATPTAAATANGTLGTKP